MSYAVLEKLIKANTLKKNFICNLYVNGGIEKAIANLLKLEKEPVYILGFSTGGYISWRTGLYGLKIKYLFAISSTRLRFETKKPKTSIHLSYGEKAPYIPRPMWFQKMGLSARFYKDETHEMYRKKEIAKDICQSLFDGLHLGETHSL
ncbi:hypothetical protein [Myroides indicus]|uniref:Alpha/beta hydrolase n=1 Tax=Myroides indicus TaxID=1323422 RepID=A0A4R7EPG6_9FLAO|nr:hypothetical protein [Myroides indicus]TDS53987.1 hypothetical protein C8P70_12621 [Myroides indicus]